MLSRIFTRSYAAPKKGAVLTKKLFGRPSNNLTSGIVGLANVGKSTFFQAITKSTLGNPANYPFATIEPEEARVQVPSKKLDFLQNLYGSQKKIPALLKIFDIAGLVRGASTGKGLGNQFLNDIRAVDGLFQVVRGFKDSEITHIEGGVDPVRDLTIVQDELLLKDMEFLENAIEKTEKLKSIKKKQSEESSALEFEIETMNSALELLMEGKRVLDNDWKDEQIDVLNTHNLLTAKASVFLVNVSEEDYVSQTNEFLDSIKEWVDENAPNSPVILFSADYETKLNLESPGVTQESSALPEIINSMRDVLNLISYYTCGPIEARQWTLRSGLMAPQAAGIIHSDFEKTFINAEVFKFTDVVDYTPPFDEKVLKSKGVLKRVGKTYVVEDGDIIHFNSAKAKK